MQLKPLARHLEAVAVDDSGLAADGASGHEIGGLGACRAQQEKQGQQKGKGRQGDILDDRKAAIIGLSLDLRQG